MCFLTCIVEDLGGEVAAAARKEGGSERDEKRRRGKSDGNVKMQVADTSRNQDSHLAVGHAVEIIGKVDQNLHVKVQAVTDFGTNIGMCMSLFSFSYHRLVRSRLANNKASDFNAANAVVEATHRYKEIFYDDN